MVRSSQIVKVGLGVLGTSTIISSSFGIHSALQDKTIEHKVIRNGKELINKKEVFEVAFKQHREDKDFLALINITDDNNINGISLLEKAGVNLSNWCNENRKILLTDDKAKKLIPKVEKYCTKPFITIKERLDKLGKQLASDWGERLNKIEGWNNIQKNRELMGELLTFISGSSGYGYNLDTWKTGLMNWCTTKADTSLTKDRDDHIFNKINEWCLKEKP